VFQGGLDQDFSRAVAWKFFSEKISENFKVNILAKIFYFKIFDFNSGGASGLLLGFGNFLLGGLLR